MGDYEQFDSDASLQEAKSRLPLHRLMEQHGDTPPPTGKKWAACPFCKKKDTARITDDGKQLFFKCANDTCPSQTDGEGKAWTELHYLSFKTGFTGRELFIAYLKEANVWKERKRYQPKDIPPTVPKQEPTDSPKPENVAPTGEFVPQNAESVAPSASNEVDDEEVIQQCIEVILSENRASVSLIQRRLRLGYTRASRIMDELERRAVVGPAKGAEPRDILLQRPAKAKTEQDLIDDDVAKFVDHLKRNEKRSFHFLDVEGVFGFARAQIIFAAIQEKKIAAPAGTNGEMELALSPAPTVQFVTSRSEVEPAKPAGRIGGEDGYAALHDFFGKLTLSAHDEKILFERRGLKSSTSVALRFRSNPGTNRGKLLEMKIYVEKEELLDSGLYVRVKKKHAEVKPNSQFCGAGIIRKLKEGEKAERNQWVDDDGNLWGWCEPVLIPYFSEMGRLVSLRPHKGGGHSHTLAGTPRIYVPREPRADGKPIQEIFPKVIITEGEFKAAALYQTVGSGRIDGKEPFGVVAVPGIWFGQNYAIREELDQWLRDVRCRVVKVAYDNEEKGDPKLESFKVERRKRYDAEIMARVIATDIANKLHIRGEVCRLPNAWRNTKGKADWDGALVELTQRKAA